jgi:beta-galactosidase
MLGRYYTTVTDMFEPYPMPQSMGNREGLRDLLLFSEEKNVGIKVQTRGNVGFSLLHYSDEHLKIKDHTWELEKGNVYAHFDCYQKGIGNGSCGNVATLDKYLIKNGAKYSCSLLFTPVTDVESGVEGVKDEMLRFNAADGVLVCEGGLENGDAVSLFNIGGVLVASCVATSHKVALPVAGLPHGSYLVVVKSAAGTRVHKVVL